MENFLKQLGISLDTPKGYIKIFVAAFVAAIVFGLMQDAFSFIC